MDLDKHVGKKLIALDINAGCSPCVESIVPADVDIEELAKTIERKVIQVFEEELGPDIEWKLRPIGVELNPRSGIIETKEERCKKREEIFKELSECLEKGDNAFDKAIEENENNGKLGWWRVEGVRHSCLVHTDNAKDAREKALKSKRVGEWELASVDYIGEPKDGVL